MVTIEIHHHRALQVIRVILGEWSSNDRPLVGEMSEETAWFLLIHIMVLKNMCYMGTQMIALEIGLEMKKIIYVSYDGLEM